MSPKLAAQLEAALQACSSRGMQPPFVVVAASANGSVTAVRLTYDGPVEGEPPLPTADTTLLCEHVEPKGFAVPVNLMIIDRIGSALHIVADVANPASALDHPAGTA
jgi:hypothetical protein